MITFLGFSAVVCVCVCDFFVAFAVVVDVVSTPQIASLTH